MAMRKREPGPTIVYVTLQRTAETLAERLHAAGFPARPYHAGMEDADREEIQNWFIASERGIVVATIAFGMGIDKADVRYVYHYNPPKSLENYAQEIGRAGRDGRPSVCEMFFCPDDLNVLENFVYGDTPSEDAVEGLVREIFANDAEFDASEYELSSTHDIRFTVVRTLLTYLELAGHLDRGTPFYATYQFKPLKTSAEILGHFDGERKTFLADLFRQAKKAKIWFQLDVDEACQTLGQPRDRVVRALDYLAEQGHLELQVAGVRHRFKLLRRPDNLAAVARSLYERALQREQREIARLGQVTALVEHDGCQVSALGNHFGDPLAASLRPLLLVSARQPPQPPAPASPAADRPGHIIAGPIAAPRNMPPNSTIPARWPASSAASPRPTKSARSSKDTRYSVSSATCHFRWCWSEWRRGEGSARPTIVLLVLPSAPKFQLPCSEWEHVWPCKYRHRNGASCPVGGEPGTGVRRNA